MALNTKLQTFVDVYDGDANKAADIAGISQQYGRRLVMSTLAAGTTPKSTEVQEAIQDRNDKIDVDNGHATHATVVEGEIDSRHDRQVFWTKTRRNEALPIGDRLRASELLGKSELDFGERHINTDVSLADIAARVGSRRRRLASKASNSDKGDNSPAERVDIGEQDNGEDGSRENEAE